MRNANSHSGPERGLAPDPSGLAESDGGLGGRSAQGQTQNT
jgi:hypothetical protein